VVRRGTSVGESLTWTDGRWRSAIRSRSGCFQKNPLGTNYEASQALAASGRTLGIIQGNWVIALLGRCGPLQPARPRWSQGRVQVRRDAQRRQRRRGRPRGLPLPGQPRYAENTLSVGFLGVNVLAPVSVKNGATTVWERWNSYSEDDGFGPVSMNSFNHYAYGAIMEWMYAYMAGIARDPDSPGF
jgi:hypothetical protein